MKISVQLEATSADELLEFFAAFHVKHLDSWAHEPKSDEIAQYPKLDTEPEQDEASSENRKMTSERAPDEASSENPKTTSERAPVQPQEDVPQQAAEPAPEKAKRTRKAKAPTVDETLQEALQEGQKQAANGHDISRQDLLDVFSEYVTKFGVSFGYNDISALLQKHLGENVRKASDVPEEALGQAYTAIKAALEENPFNRKRDYA